MGEFATPTEAFVAYSNLGGILSAIDIPGATTSSAFAINDANEITGDYVDEGGVTHGFYQNPSGALSSRSMPREQLRLFLSGSATAV